MTTLNIAPARDRRWLALTIVSFAQLMVVLDGTIVNIALPSAQHDLGFSDANRQWIVTAYALAFGSLLLLGGRISDIWGRKTTFIIGMIGFAVASVLGGLSDSFGLLVTARALQGAFGALLAPAALGILTTTFADSKERGKAFGIYGAVAGSGSAVGLLLGGILTEYASWRWCLFVNVVFAVIAVVGAAFVLKNPARAQVKPRIDVPGVVTVVAGLVGVVYGFSNAASKGWGDVWTLATLVAGVVLIAAFVMIQRRSPHPLLPLRIILDRDRGGSYLVLALTSIGMFAVFLFLTYYLQSSLGYSALTTGLAFLPMTAAILVASTALSGLLLPRAGTRIQVMIGGVLGAVGMALLTRISGEAHYAGVVLPGLVVLGLGLGLIFSATINAATLGVSGDDASVASATVSTMQQIGGSVGTALLSTLAANAVAGYLTAHGTGPAAQAEAVLSGYHLAFWVAAGIFSLIALIGGTLLRTASARTARSSAPEVAELDTPVAVH